MGWRRDRRMRGWEEEEKEGKMEEGEDHCYQFSKRP